MLFGTSIDQYKHNKFVVEHLYKWAKDQEVENFKVHFTQHIQHLAKFSETQIVTVEFQPLSNPNLTRSHTILTLTNTLGLESLTPTTH